MSLLRTASGLRQHLTCMRPAAALSFRAFHASLTVRVAVGDRLPGVELREGSPGNKVVLSEIVEGSRGRALVIGVPAAFSPGCSNSHVPGFMKHPRLKEADGGVFVISVNDPFVTKAWGEALDPNGGSGIRFLADPTAAFSQALDLAFDGTSIFGNVRGKRYALVIEDGKVKKAYVEPDNTGIEASTAEKVFADW